jgi:hypothetical protein
MEAVAPGLQPILHGDGGVTGTRWRIKRPQRMVALFRLHQGDPFEDGWKEAAAWRPLSVTGDVRHYLSGFS